MGSEWRPSTWGKEISLEYGKSLKGYRDGTGSVQVYGSNGPVGWTEKAPLAYGPGVILGRKGAYRGVQYSEDPFYVIDTAYYVKPKTDLDMRWLYYSIIHHKLGEIDDGSPIPSTTRSAVYVTDVDIPPLPEQKAIAHILGTLDDKIEANRRMNATLEGMAQALFKSWFVDFDPVIDNILVKNLQKGASLEPSPSLSQGERNLAANSSTSPSGRSGDEGSIFDGIPDELAPRAEVRRQALANGTANREAAKAFPDSFQETEELGWIPEGWDVKPIEDCIQRFPSGKKYATKTAEETGAVPILDQGKSGLIGYHNDEPGVMASPDDPIIVFANHTCYMRLIMFDFSAIQNVLPFKGDGLNIFWLFEATKGRQQFNEYKGHWPDFAIKKLVVPTLPLVSFFCEMIEVNHRKIYANELENQALTKLRDTLLPKLISGELRVYEAEQLTEEALASLK